MTPRALPRIFVSAVAATTVAFVGVAPSAFAAKGGKPSTSTGACEVSAPASPSWLQISASGLTPGVMYQVLVMTPGGNQLGDVLYPNQDGTINDTNLYAGAPGTYSVTLNKFHGSSVGTCSTVVA